MTGNYENPAEDLPDDLFDFILKLASEPADALAGPEKTPSDAKVRKKVSDAESRAAQEHGFRNELFKTIKGTLVGTLISAVGVMVAYIVSAWGEVDAAVMVSFFGAVVVQTIGLSYIVANYVFDRDTKIRSTSGPLND